MSYVDAYLAVDPDFHENLNGFIAEKLKGKVHFFNEIDEVDEAEGVLTGIKKLKNGEFLIMEEDQKVRLDKIITVIGKPGPAYEQYERFANACLSCFDEGQF